MSDSTSIRHASYAGSWYPKEKRTLEGLLDRAIASVKGTPQPSNCAVLAHAGLSYSALGMADFFHTVADHTKRLVLLAPSHTTSLNPDRLVTGSFSSFETPLGAVKGFSLPGIHKGFDHAIAREHAIEMVLPFLGYINQKRENPISYSPALISNISNGFALSELCDELMQAIGRDSLESGETVLVASSDFTHYGRRFGYTPYDKLQREAQRKHVRDDDLFMARLLADGKSEEALALFKEKKPSICGMAATLIVSEIARRLSLKGKVESYYTSYDLAPGDDNSFVAYCTILWR